MIKLFLVVAAGLFVIGCSKDEPEQKVTEVKYEKYAVARIDPPKHYRADLKHIESGFVFKDAASRKHCNKWRESPVGTYIVVKTYYYENGTFAISRDHAASALCD